MFKFIILNSYEFFFKKTFYIFLNILIINFIIIYKLFNLSFVLIKLIIMQLCLCIFNIFIYIK